MAQLLSDNALPAPPLPERLAVSGAELCAEQREAVELALIHRLSVITGGAGSGKTTLIKAISSNAGPGETILCAPTGKAARNLSAKTGLEARTVHSVLGLKPNGDSLTPVTWEAVSLVVIDEASMMTLEMLAGILNRVKSTCRVVLLGDLNQLLSVGSGNVLPDLLTLGVPHIRLKSNHRQDADAQALLHNVTTFSKIRSASAMHFDESFIFCEMPDCQVKDALVTEAARRFLNGESVQVLAPCNRNGACSVYNLNMAIRKLVNPADPGKMELSAPELAFRDGDRVLIRRNDWERNCSNGDVGILHITSDDADAPEYFVELPDGCCPSWNDLDGLRRLSLAYAITIHKFQGSEFDTILMPVMSSFGGISSRNLLYTAVSRAKKRVILYGDRNALDTALRRPVQERRTMLVSKVMTRMMEVCA